MMITLKSSKESVLNKDLSEEKQTEEERSGETQKVNKNQKKQEETILSDSSENYIQRLEELEAIGNDVSGVEKAYAVQAGRELRVMVKPEEVDDLTAYQIAREIKEKIENELKYPGTIKVTVIRETRCTEEAK